MNLGLLPGQLEPKTLSIELFPLSLDIPRKVTPLFLAKLTHHS
jgi:hypothetical protein